MICYKEQKPVGFRWLQNTTFLLIGALALAPAQAFALDNSAPAGAILDLAGGETGTAPQTINHSGTPVLETVDFVAGLSNTDIAFAFREDPNYFSFGSVLLVDDTTSSGNLLTNGDFSGGTYSDPVSVTDPNGNGAVPDDWSYANIYGATAQGRLTGCGEFASGNCWYDGSVGAYDLIDQVVGTTIGDTYTLSFLYTDGSGQSLFSDVDNSTEDGDEGIDILAYAQAGLPVACPPGTICVTTPSTPSSPEPASLALIGSGLAAIGAVRRRKKN